MRKALMAEQKKNEMQTNITQLRQACEELESEVTRLDQEIIRGKRRRTWIKSTT